MTPEELTWYEILEIPFDATSKEVRQAFLKGVKRYHPDANTSMLGRDLFHKTQEAYNILSDPEKRSQYDALIKIRRPHEKQIDYTLTFSVESIPRLKESVLVYALLKIHSMLNEETIPRRLPGIYCLVIDRSTSMKGSRISQIKDSLVRLVHLLKPEDMISVIVFNDKAEIILTPTRVADIGDLSDKLEEIKCAGGTEIFSGLKAAGDLLWHGGSTEAKRHLILFTDGDTYGDENACIEIAHKMQVKGISLNIFGFGSDWNDVFLDQLSGITAGCTTFVSNDEALQQGLQNIVRTNTPLVAKGLSLDFKLEDAVKIEFVYRLDPHGIPVNLHHPLLLGDLQVNATLAHLIAFKIDPIEDQTKTINLIAGNLWYHLSGKNETLQKTGILLQLPVKGKTLVTNPPHEILEILSRISIYQMQEKANMDVKNGNVQNAIERLGNISTQLFKQGNHSLALMAISEADKLRTNNCYSEDGEKQLKYGTRTLLSPEKLRENQT